MAKLEYVRDFILSFEGGWSNHPNDKGGQTNMGVTLTTWRVAGYDKDLDGDIDADDLRLIDKDDVVNRVMRPMFWDKIKGDEIQSQAVANILLDWAWMSGAKKVIMYVQRMISVKADGIVGPITIKAINDKRPYNLFCQIQNERKDFYDRIVANNPSQKVFLRGWTRRLMSIHYTELELNNGKKISIDE